MAQEEVQEYEEEARAQGWKPQEEFGGENDNFVDAKEFLDRGEKYAGLLRKKVDRLERRLSKSESVNQEVSAHYNRVLEKERSEAKVAISNLEAQRAEAVRVGDGETFNRTDAQLQEMRTQQGAQQLPVDPKVQEWIDSHEWYNTDVALTGVAEAHAARLREQNPTMPTEVFLEKVTELVKKDMPHKFTNANKGNLDVEGDSLPGGDNPVPSGKRTYKSLPSATKQICDQMIAEGLVSDRAAYVDAYDWDQED